MIFPEFEVRFNQIFDIRSYVLCSTIMDIIYAKMTSFTSVIKPFLILGLVIHVTIVTGHCHGDSNLVPSPFRYFRFGMPLHLQNRKLALSLYLIVAIFGLNASFVP